MQVPTAPWHTTRQSICDDVRMGGQQQDFMYKSCLLGKGERDGLTRADEILNRERLAEFLILEMGFQPAPGADHWPKTFLIFVRNPVFFFSHCCFLPALARFVTRR